MGLPRSPSLHVFLLALVVALSGCLGWHGGGPFDGHHHPGPHGYDGGGEDADGTYPYTGNESVDLEVTGGEPSEYRFSPDRYEVPAGERVGVVFTNEGDIDHEFAVKAADFRVDAGSGETARAAFVAPDEPGEYKVGCYLPGHYEEGMKGTLVVTS